MACDFKLSKENSISKIIAIREKKEAPQLFYYI